MRVISGNNLQLPAQSVSNAGQLLASKGLEVNAKPFLHQGGDIGAEHINTQADSITLSTNLQDALRQASLSATDISLSGQDIQLQGSQAKAGGQLTADAGHNLNIQADTTTTKTHLEAGSSISSVSSTREEERLLLSKLSGDKGVSLNAGNHLLAEGAQVDSREGKVTVSAKNVSMTAATQNTSAQDEEKTHSSRKSKGSRVDATSSHSVTGSTFSGQNGVDITARTHDITVTGSAIHSEKGAVNLAAQNNVVLNTATEETKSYLEAHHSKTAFFSFSSEHTIQNDETICERDSLLSGEKVTVNAGNNLTVAGASVVAEQDVRLRAGNNVDITAPLKLTLIT